MARSSRASIAPANRKVDSPSMVSRGAWYSAASPAGMPPSAPHEAASQRSDRTASMTAKAAHATVIAVDEPTEVAVGSDFVLTVFLSCPAGCNLSGVPVEATAPDGTATTVEPAHGEADTAARRIAL